LTELKLPGREQANTFKLSQYLSLQADQEQVMSQVAKRLDRLGGGGQPGLGVDEPEQIGLLDVLLTCDQITWYSISATTAGYRRGEVLLLVTAATCQSSVAPSVQCWLPMPTTKKSNEHVDLPKQEWPIHQPSILPTGELPRWGGYYAAGFFAEGSAIFIPEYRDPLERVGMCIHEIITTVDHFGEVLFDSFPTGSWVHRAPFNVA
jgi:hypothetical protein